jgi:hypothetical protein
MMSEKIIIGQRGVLTLPAKLRRRSGLQQNDERINLDLRLVHDTMSAAELPDWVQGYRQTTDAYLGALAQQHGLKLLTINKHIPGAERLIS